MYKKLLKHQGYYISLILILLTGIIFTFLASPIIKMQLMIIILTTFFYVFWGIIHHQINHELSLKIMIEYVLIGILGISILFFMQMGGLI